MWSHVALLLAIGVSLIAGKAIETSEVRRLEERIFKGAYDEENVHRYHVAILKIVDNESVEHICGGAIVDSKYVLTAAHCVYGIPKNNLIVRSGWNKAPEQPWLERRVFHGVVRVMYLKDFVLSPCRHHQHDIAIIKVSRQFDLSSDSDFKKVALPEPYSDYDNFDATLTGYGVEKITVKVNKTSHTAKKVLKYSDELKYLNTKVIPLEQCKEVMDVIVTKTNLCTQGRNPAGFSCIGDSGGPLVRDGTVIGIRNSHNAECIQAAPELFTRVSSYLSFIQKVLNREFSSNIVYV